MFTWGEYNLRVKVGSYVPPFPAVSVQELELIPSGTEYPSTALQAGGRGRMKPSLTVKTTADTYNALYQHHLLSTVKTFTDPYANTVDCMISSISPPTIRIGWLECDIQFIEV